MIYVNTKYLNHFKLELNLILINIHLAHSSKYYSWILQQIALFEGGQSSFLTCWGGFRTFCDLWRGSKSPPKMFDCPALPQVFLDTHSEQPQLGIGHLKSVFWTMNSCWCSYCWKTENVFFYICKQSYVLGTGCINSQQASALQIIWSAVVQVDNLRRIPFCFVQGCIVGLLCKNKQNTKNNIITHSQEKILH